jgi:hypothetical protein
MNIRRHIFAVAATAMLATGAYAADIKLGVSGPFTGGSSSMGVSMRDGVRLATKEINAAGGINGNKIVLIERDDEAKNERGVQIAQELINNETSHSDSTLSKSSDSEAIVTIPEIRPAMRPELSSTRVVGIALAGNDLLNPIRTESSIRVGYGLLFFRTNASALTGLSRVKIPTKLTSGYFSASSASTGSSARHGEHQEAHTLITAY